MVEEIKKKELNENEKSSSSSSSSNDPQSSSITPSSSSSSSEKNKKKKKCRKNKKKNKCGDFEPFCANFNILLEKREEEEDDPFEFCCKDKTSCSCDDNSLLNTFTRDICKPIFDLEELENTLEILLFSVLEVDGKKAQLIADALLNIQSFLDNDSMTWKLDICVKIGTVTVYLKINLR